MLTDILRRCEGEHPPVKGQRATCIDLVPRESSQTLLDVYVRPSDVNLTDRWPAAVIHLVDTYSVGLLPDQASDYIHRHVGAGEIVEGHALPQKVIHLTLRYTLALQGALVAKSLKRRSEAGKP